MTTVRERLSPADIVRAVESHRQLSRAVTEIAGHTKLSEDVVRAHLTDALGETLERLGEVYIREMGDTIAHVDGLRDQVHQFYDRVLTGQDPNPDTAQLSSLFTQLHESVLKLSDPQAWAKAKGQAELLDVMAQDQGRGVSSSAQPVGGAGTATENLTPVEPYGGRNQLPRNNGGWTGERGKSGWLSTNVDVIRITHGEPIEYVNGEPVLTPYAEEQVVIRGMTGDGRRDFANARRRMMELFPGRWNDVTHVEQWETLGVSDLWGNALAERHTWHHEPDVEGMTLVPTALHANLPHSGGASLGRRGVDPVRIPPFSTSPLDVPMSMEVGDDQ